MDLLQSLLPRWRPGQASIVQLIRAMASSDERPLIPFQSSPSVPSSPPDPSQPSPRLPSEIIDSILEHYFTEYLEDKRLIVPKGSIGIWRKSDLATSALPLLLYNKSTTTKYLSLLYRAIYIHTYDQLHLLFTQANPSSFRQVKTLELQSGDSPVLDLPPAQESLRWGPKLDKLFGDFQKKMWKAERNCLGVQMRNLRAREGEMIVHVDDIIAGLWSVFGFQSIHLLYWVSPLSTEPPSQREFLLSHSTLRTFHSPDLIPSTVTSPPLPRVTLELGAESNLACLWPYLCWVPWLPLKVYLPLRSEPGSEMHWLEDRMRTDGQEAARERGRRGFPIERLRPSEIRVDGRPGDLSALHHLLAAEGRAKHYTLEMEGTEELAHMFCGVEAPRREKVKIKRRCQCVEDCPQRGREKSLDEMMLLRWLNMKDPSDEAHWALMTRWKEVAEEQVEADI